MDNTLVETENKAEVAPLVAGAKGMRLVSLDDYWRFAGMVLKGGMATKSDTQASIVIKLQMGAEVGLTPMQAIQNVAVINGRPSLWGDALLGVCQGSPVFDHAVFKEEAFGEPGTPEYGWRCTVCRRGGQPITRVFTRAMAKDANLLGKSGPWSQYTDRMLQMRARGFALRDGFADVLKGLCSVEEAQDIIDVAIRPGPALGTEGLRDRLLEQAPSAEGADGNGEKPAEQAAAPEPEPKPVPKAKPSAAPRGELARVKANIIEIALDVPSDKFDQCIADQEFGDMAEVAQSGDLTPLKKLLAALKAELKAASKGAPEQQGTLGDVVKPALRVEA